MLKEEVMGKITYLVNFPKEFDENKKYPVIIFLHGAGSRGENTEKLRTNPYFKICAKHKNFPFITVAPLCSENTWFDMFESLKELVYHILQSGYAVLECGAPQRYACMGVSRRRRRVRKVLRKQKNG